MFSCEFNKSAICEGELESQDTLKGFLKLFFTKKKPVITASYPSIFLTKRASQSFVTKSSESQKHIRSPLALSRPTFLAELTPPFSLWKTYSAIFLCIFITNFP